MTKKISFVISVYNEANNLPDLLKELDKVRNKYKPLEIIFIDDGSIDRSYSIIKEEAEKSEDIKIIKFSRNYGHEAAMRAGIEYATGDAICVMDSDLQHPVDIAIKITDKILEGKDVVFGKRKCKNLSVFSIRRICSVFYYYLLKKTTKLPLEEGFTDFFAISKKIKEYLLDLKEQYSFIRGQIIWPYREVDYITYEEPKRKFGFSKYNFKTLIGLAIYSMFTYSKIPVTYLLFTALFSTIISLYILIKSTYDRFILKVPIEGFPTIYGLLLLIIGLNLFFYSIIIEYVLIIFQHQKSKPSYFISKEINFDKKNKE